MTRPLLEFVARRADRAREQHRAEPALSGHSISGSARQDRGDRRTLRTTRNGQSSELAADLVVDASSRGALTLDLLDRVGLPRPKETANRHRPALCDGDVRDTVFRRPLTGARCCIGLPPRAAAAGCLSQSRTTAGKSISPTCMAEPCLKTSGTSSDLPGRCERRRFMPRSRTPYPSVQFTGSSFRAAFAGASRRLSVFRIVCCRSAMRSADSIRRSARE